MTRHLVVLSIEEHSVHSSTKIYGDRVEQKTTSPRLTKLGYVLSLFTKSTISCDRKKQNINKQLNQSRPETSNLFLRDP